MVRLLPSDSPLDRMLSYYLADRVQYGAAFHLVMVSFFAFGTQAGQTHRTAGILFSILLTATGILRFATARTRIRHGASDPVPAGVNRRFVLSYLLHTVIWNLYTSYVLYFCFGDVIAESIMVICIAGTSSSATTMLSASRALSFYYVVSQSSVAIVWGYFAQQHYGPVILIVMIVYLVFQLGVCRSQCDHTEAMFAAQLKLKANGEELARARDLAEEASNARSRFLASMSHEIRTPLNGLLGLAQILRDESRSDALERAEMFATMIRSGDHLRSIVDDILDYSKITAGRMVLEQTVVDLNRLIREAVESLASSAQSKSLRLDVSTLPGTAAMVTGDPVRLRQIVLNLLSNAIKFTQQGGVEIRLEPGSRRNLEEVRLQVIDTGIGIAPEDQGRLFQDFQQLDASTKRRFGGTGLGLAITKSLVEQMGGTIAIESAKGVGTKFIVDLPLPRAVGLPATQTGQLGDIPAVPLRETMRILVAEDNPVNQRIAQVMLRETGAERQRFGSGAVPHRGSVRPHLHGRQHAGDGWLRGDRRHPCSAGGCRQGPHCGADGQCFTGRPRPLPGRRHDRLFGQTVPPPGTVRTRGTLFRQQVS